MNSIMFSLLAAGFTALSSFFFRRNIDSSSKNYSASGYLTVFFLFSFLFSFSLSSDIWNFNINPIILGIGMVVGVLNSTLMLFTSRALKCGPSGLTFAFLNASAVFPGLILLLLLGSDYGFSWSVMQLIGMMLVLLGLFLGSKEESKNHTKASFAWLKYAIICFVVQILALTFIQARCVIFDCRALDGFFSGMIPTQADDIWFMPGQFGISFIMQFAMFLSEKKKFYKSEVIYGGLGGVANFTSTYLLLLATKYALPFEKGILFPCFAVAAMILCNVWANKFYKEEFNLKTNALCSLGIFMAISS